MTSTPEPTTEVVEVMCRDLVAQIHEIADELANDGGEIVRRAHALARKVAEFDATHDAKVAEKARIVPERYDGPLRNRIGDGALVDYSGRLVAIYYVDSVEAHDA